MPGKDARRTALIQVKIVALAPMPKANVVTTTNVKPGFLNSVRRLYRKSCQKVSMISLFLLSTPIDSASDFVNVCWASVPENLPPCITINLCVFGRIHGARSSLLRPNHITGGSRLLAAAECAAWERRSPQQLPHCLLSPALSYTLPFPFPCLLPHPP